LPNGNTQKWLYRRKAAGILLPVAVHLWEKVSGSGQAQELYANTYPEASDFFERLSYDQADRECEYHFNNDSA
jgi:hypothetical protein